MSNAESAQQIVSRLNGLDDKYNIHSKDAAYWIEKFLNQRDEEVKSMAKRGADRMAYQIARLVTRKVIDCRNPASDAMTDYLRIGSGGPDDVLVWVEQYEQSVESGGK